VSGAAAALLLCCCEEAVPEPVPELGRTVCDQRTRCDCGDEVSEESCRAVAEELFSRYASLPPSSGLEYDPECGATVVAAYESLGCGTEAELTFDLSRGRVIECGRCRLYRGTKQLGEPCEWVDVTACDDCTQGLFCFVEGDDQSAEGTCVDPCETAGLGEPCIWKQCGEGLVCGKSTDSRFCQLPGGEGESCHNGTCAEGLVYGTISGKCMTTPQIGEPCDGACAPGAHCSSAGSGTSTCQPRKLAGEACSSRFECESLQCDEETLVCTGVEPLVCSQRF
jgi:hypothetical protein